MSSSDISLLEATQNDLEMWKNRYFALSTEHQRVLGLLKNCKCAAKQDPDENGQSTVQKRLKLDEIPTDPLRLPEPCAMRILHFLSSKELIDATQVSTGWRHFIEAREKLMKRATNGTKIKISLDHSDLKEIFSSQSQRHYKHMQIVSNSNDERSGTLSWLLGADSERVSKLESLKILADFNAYEVNFSDFKFPNLKKLKFYFDGPLYKVKEGSYPELTTLVAFTTEHYMGIDNLKTFLRQFPKLQSIFLGDNEHDDETDLMFLWDDIEPQGTIPEFVVEDPSQPKLEIIAFPSYTYPSTFLRCQQSSLTKLLIWKMTTLDLSFCLRDLKQLKCLTVKYLDNEKDFNITQPLIYPQNDSIRVLRVRGNELIMNDFAQVLLALPSLEELTVSFNYNYRATRLDIRFIASHMRHLKWLKIGEITDEDGEVYNEIKENADQYINTDFELTDDGDVNYETFEEFEM